MSSVDSLVNWDSMTNIKVERDADCDNYNLTVESGVNIKTENFDDFYDDNLALAYAEEYIEVSKTEYTPSVSCTICNRLYMTQSDLEKHLYCVHRPLSLEIKGDVYCCKCHTWFESEIYYVLHGPCYAFEANCSLCNIDTSEFSLCQLNRHMKEKHGRLGYFQCKKCMLYYGTCDAIYRHIIDVHSDSSGEMKAVCVCSAEDRNRGKLYQRKIQKPSEEKTRSPVDRKKKGRMYYTRTTKLEKKRKTEKIPTSVGRKKDGRKYYTRAVKHEMETRSESVTDNSEYALQVNRSTNVTYSRDCKCNFSKDFDENQKLSHETGNQRNEKNLEEETFQKVSTRELQLSKSWEISAQKRVFITITDSLPAGIDLIDVPDTDIHETKSSNNENMPELNKFFKSPTHPLNDTKTSVSSAPRKKSKKGEPETYLCQICDSKFSEEAELKCHYRLVHRPWALQIKNKLYCPECSNWFSDEKLYTGHSPCHVHGVCRRCPICYVESPAKDHFTLHRLTHHSNHIYSCTICDNDTKYSIKELNIHRQEDHKHNGVFECVDCNINFSNSYDLKIHIVKHKSGIIHSGVCTYSRVLSQQIKLKYYKCKICDKILFELNNVQKHIKKHEGNLCSVCGLKFNQPGYLREHFNGKHAKNVYPCETCKRTFSRRKYLLQHEQIHKMEKNFACDVCQQSFTQQTSLIYHMATHTKENIFTCTMCDIKFDLQSKLTSHMQMHTANGTNPHVCKVCQKAFSHECNLRVHMRTHAS